jgi:hypothetical protein
MAGAFVVAGLLGRATAPDSMQADPRRSALLAGPAGARGLAETLRRLGVPVELRRRGLRSVAAAAPRQLLVVLEPARRLTLPEIRAVRQFVARGGHLLAAGSSALTGCFGLAARPVTGPALPVVAPVAGWNLPPARALLERERSTGECIALRTVRADTLLETRSGRVAALALSTAGGGHVTLVADAGYLSNRALKETDAGLLVVPWFLGEGSHRVVFDEYDQGFGDQGSLGWAAARWLTAAPAGWAMLQIAAGALGALAFLAVRFGPATSGVERRRRSPLEHLEALATGLERSDGADTAVALLVAGLRRRLRRTGALARGKEQAWLATLARAVPNQQAEDAVRRLAALTHGPGGGDRVLAAALAAEDVWKALGQEAKLRMS